jgi:hypothetical protein
VPSLVIVKVYCGFIVNECKEVLEPAQSVAVTSAVYVPAGSPDSLNEKFAFWSHLFELAVQVKTHPEGELTRFKGKLPDLTTLPLGFFMV